MKARVFVSLRPSVLDPEGQTIHAALKSLGHHSIAAVRQGKVFELDIDSTDADAVRRQVEQIAHDVLANPVIESYRVEVDG
jgi:phosphoribosylformylglycinamidine synthase PurS subunit